MYNVRDYNSPLWQRKRNAILERDDYQCQLTFDRDNPLCVHHKYYKINKKPWEYPDSCLITLNKDVHTNMHKALNNNMIYKDYAEWLNVTPTDIFIYMHRLTQICNREGVNGIKTAIELLTSYVIKQNEI